MTILRRRWDELRLAAALLTRVPVGSIAEPVPRLARAAWAMPLVGVPVGGLVWATIELAGAAGLGPAPGAVLALGAGILMTGALHHDGLADFADGMGAGGDAARRLEIMRDSRIGTYGMLASVLALALIGSALAAGPSLAWCILLAVGSRLAMLATLVALPAARPDGLGRMAGGPKARALWPGAATVLAGILLLGPSSATALLAMAVAGWLIARLARRRLGGQTGDVLGAVQVVSEAAGWTIFAAIAG